MEWAFLFKIMPVFPPSSDCGLFFLKATKRAVTNAELVHVPFTEKQLTDDGTHVYIGNKNRNWENQVRFIDTEVH